MHPQVVQNQEDLLARVFDQGFQEIDQSLMASRPSATADGRSMRYCVRRDKPRRTPALADLRPLG